MSDAQEKIGLFLISESQRYQQFVARDVHDAAARHGIEVEVRWADGIGVQQSRDIIHFLNQNADRRVCVLVHPVSDQDETAAGLARRVLNKGAGWIVLNRAWEEEIRKLRYEFPRLLVAMVSVDNRRFGHIQGQQFRALLPEGGQVLYVLGNPFVSSTIARREGMLLETSGSSITVLEVDGMWSTEYARDAVYKWLTSPLHRDADIRLVGCQNDAMAAGARAALERVANEESRPELLRIPLTGGDGLEDQGQLWVQEKKLAATIIMPSPGELAVNMIASAWRDKRIAPTVTLLTPTSYPPIEDIRPDR